MARNNMKPIESYFFKGLIPKRMLNPESTKVFMKLRKPLVQLKAIGRVENMLREHLELEGEYEEPSNEVKFYTFSYDPATYKSQGWESETVTSSFTFDMGKVEGWELNMATRELEEVRTVGILGTMELPLASPSEVKLHMEKYRGTLTGKKYGV
jgi:hypothetical protein